MRLKIYKSRVWIYSHVGNKNTHRHFKNIKELTSDNFLKRFLGDLMGLIKGGVISKSPYPL
ncbi:hypothetical protein [Helicobacter pylori]|uniref:hypothetical protein n=1 Tax=Helicobacter pylori TaxID=210 RepID=UPI0030EF2E7C